MDAEKIMLLLRLDGNWKEGLHDNDLKQEPSYRIIFNGFIRSM